MTAFKNQRLVRFLLIVQLAGLWTAGAIDWGSGTSSTSDNLYLAEIGEVITIEIPEGERASVEFTGGPADYFSVSYRQCAEEEGQPLQIQYSGQLNYMPFVGGCIYVQNNVTEIGEVGCTFWQYNPSETYAMMGKLVENKKLLEPGRVRFENQGTANATVEVVLFSDVVSRPPALVDSRVWIEDHYVKKDNVINTTTSVFINNDESYCEVYGCTVSGWTNEYVEGKDSLSLCEVMATGTKSIPNERFNGAYLPFSFVLEGGDYFVTLILSATDTTQGHANFTELADFGQEHVVVFQTDTTQAENTGKVLAGLSGVALTWLILFNTLFATLGSDNAQQGQQANPALGW